VFGWACSIDLTSLYPSGIRALNISPETHRFQCLGNTEDFIKINARSLDDIQMKCVASGELLTIPAFEVYDLLRDENLTISAWGSIYDSGHIGLIPEVLGIWFAERQEQKELANSYFLEGDMVKAEYWDLRNILTKLSLNCLYGAVSNRYCIFYSIDLAASITITGQYINKFQIWKGDRIISERV